MLFITVLVFVAGVSAIANELGSILVKRRTIKTKPAVSPKEHKNILLKKIFCITEDKRNLSKIYAISFMSTC